MNIVFLFEKSKLINKYPDKILNLNTLFILFFIILVLPSLKKLKYIIYITFLKLRYK